MTTDPHNNRFYKQEYCGCTYSLRDTNLYRKQAGIPPVKIGGEQAGLGNRYFSDPLADAEEENQEVVDAFFASAENNFDDERRAMYAARKKTAGSQIEVGGPAAVEQQQNSTELNKVSGGEGEGEAATSAPVKPKSSLLSMLNNW